MIDNFRYTGKTGTGYSSWNFYATVDVTSGIFFKKTVTKEISKSYSGHWFFVDGGAFVTDNTVNELVRAFEAQSRNELQDIEVGNELG